MSIRKAFVKLSGSMVGYLPIKIMEGLIGILTLKVYTSLFVPEVYGEYTIISPIISVLFLVCLGWIIQGVTRFSDTYSKDPQKSDQFYSTLFFSFLSLMVVISVVIGGAMALFPSLQMGKTDSFILIIVMVLFSYSMNQILLTHLLYSDKRLLNSVLLLTSVILKLVVTVLLTKVLGNTILAIFISQSAVDFTVGLIAIFSSTILSHIHLKSFSKDMLGALVRFGYPLIGLSLAMVVLNVSDRYIIDIFFTNNEVGLYTTNYAISSSIFTMIMFGLSRGIYPKILKAWNEGNQQEAKNKLSIGGRYYLMLALPAAAGLYLLSAPIASVCLDAQYFGGKSVIGIVAFGMFFLGLAEYANRGWELKVFTYPILINCIIAAILKIGMNFAFLPVLGYKFAAYSTLIAFFLYFVISYFRSHPSMRLSIGKKSLVNILLSCGVMAIIVLAYDYFFLIDLVGMLVVIPLAAFGYFACLFVTGEIKNEIKNLF